MEISELRIELRKTRALVLEAISAVVHLARERERRVPAAEKRSEVGPKTCPRRGVLEGQPEGEVMGLIHDASGNSKCIPRRCKDKAK
jgi:hypothetical protein